MMLSAAARVYQRLIEVNSAGLEAARASSEQLLAASKQRAKVDISGQDMKANRSRVLLC